jgi:alcohol dehydrogenase YqhD (iron-dependent ADH family)
MKCKICGKNADGDLCFQHKPKRQLQQRKIKSSSPSKKLDKSSSKFLEMRQFFLSIWDKRAHRSEVSGTYLGNEAMSTYFHHILAKEKYSEACLDEENIILLTLEEHSNVENDMYRYEEVNKRREQLKLKYKL